MAKKRVLVVYYSQTGQLEEIVRSIAGPLVNDPTVEVHFENLRPVKPFPFPWRFYSFFDVFPESVYQIAPELEPLNISGDQRFDLVILAYQVWFLSPSLPIAAFLKSPVAQQLLKGAPVVTVIGCRNMWLNAQETVKDLLRQTGARLLDNVVLVDSANSLATFITTPYWLLTGRKKMGRLFPPAGVGEQEIRDAARFGRALSQALVEGKETGSGPLLSGLKAVNVNERLIASEKIGYRSFRLWGRLLRALGGPGSVRRKIGLSVYAVFLIAMILTVVPITMAVKILLRPLLEKSLLRQKAYFELPSGSSEDRMKDFANV